MLYDTNYLLTVSINMYDVILMIGFILFHLTILYYYLKDIFDSSSFMNLIRYRKTKLDFLISIITTNIKKSIILSVSIFFIICIIGCIENYGIHYIDTYKVIW